MSVSCSLFQSTVAQETPPNIPDPSKLEDQFDTRDLPQSKAVIRVPADKEGGLKPENDIRFQLTKVFIEGASVFSEKDLAAFFDEYINTEVSISQAFEIAARMTAFYRNRGYILSRVIVPAQVIESGVLNLLLLRAI